MNMIFFLVIPLLLSCVEGNTGAAEDNLDKGSSSCFTTNGEVGQCVSSLNCTNTESPSFKQAGIQCHSSFVCCPLNTLRNPKKLVGCGRKNGFPFTYRSRNTNPVSFAEFAEFPWMVALLRPSENDKWNYDDYIGGGSLIHPSVVLTAAHKVDYRDPSEIKCRAGEWDTSATMEIWSHQERSVRKISIHPDYMLVRNHYNAALLFLETPFILKSHIGVACLPGDDLPSIGTLCYSMGWGRTFNDSNYSTQLKKVKLPLVDPTVCQRQLRNTVLGSGYLLHHSLICAGGELGVDTCVGDGGAPLVCPIETEGSTSSRFAVYGMVSHGVGCGNRNVPGLYTKVSEVLDWVDYEMDQEKLNKTYII